jgi:hypothetical protein
MVPQHALNYNKKNLKGPLHEQKTLITKKIANEYYTYRIGNSLILMRI